MGAAGLLAVAGHRRGGAAPPAAAAFTELLYTGDGSYPRTITGAGDTYQIAWIKNRDQPDNHQFVVLDGSTYRLGQPDNTSAWSTPSNFAFNADGFTLSSGSGVMANESGERYVVWLFKSVAGVLDILVYDGTSGDRTLPHNLGAAPAAVICGRQITESTTFWEIGHKDAVVASGGGWLSYGLLHTNSQWVNNDKWQDTAPDASNIYVDNSLNSTGQRYMLMLFGHQTESEGKVYCGAWTGNGNSSGPTINMGRDPNGLLMVWPTNAIRNRRLIDADRGFANYLEADVANAEASNTTISLTGTGFQIVSTDVDMNGNGTTFCFVALDP